MQAKLKRGQPDLALLKTGSHAFLMSRCMSLLQQQEHSTQQVRHRALISEQHFFVLCKFVLCS